MVFFCGLEGLWGGVGCGCGRGCTGFGLHKRVAAQTEGFTKSVGTLSPEQNGGHAQSGGVGHEGEAVLRRHRDQSVGRGLLRPSEAVQRRPTQVSASSSLLSSLCSLKQTHTSIFFKKQTGMLIKHRRILA